MPIVAQIGSLHAAGVLMALGAVGLYVTSRAAADALVRGVTRAAPGRLALGHWVPIVCVACLAALAGRGELAVGVVFASSAAAVTLALGMVNYVSPMDVPPPSRRAWQFLLPAALLVLVAGFSAGLNAWHALLLLVLGGAILPVWHAAPGEDATVGEVLAELDEADAARSGDQTLRALQWVLAAGFGAAAAKAVVSGAAAADTVSRSFSVLTRALSPQMLSAAVIGPVLILPTLATGTDLAQRGRSGEAAGALVGLALLNLCALLPIVILLWYFQSAWAGGGFTGYLHRLVHEAVPLPFPLAVWRVDNVLLLLIGFGLIPVSLGRWALGRIEATGLILAYAAYLAVTAQAALRP